jgi:thiol-disulfide isomerase/thioredoxin
MMSQKSDTTYIINFWATWCKPCVKELPYFESLHKELKGSKYRLILVSLDFKKHFESRLLPFVEKNQLQSEVYLLDEPDYNSWIDKVDSSWGGSIPATLFYNHFKKVRYFKEQEFDKQELIIFVKSII